MKIYHKLTHRMLRSPLALAIGFFDGFHRGHQALIESLRPFAQHGGRLAALSFRQHPLTYLRPMDAPQLIMPVEERVNLLADSGVEELYLLDFDEQIASLTAEVFLEEILIKQLQVIAVSVGMNFRFGAQRRGDIHLARAVFAKHEVAFQAIEHIVDGGARISSTRIRAALREARMAEVDALLGRPYRLAGMVMLGAGRGHDLGFPTANLALIPGILLPPDGVYACRAWYAGRAYAALVSIGTNPTFGGQSRTIEVWLRGFSSTIYGRELVIESLSFIRGQQHFESVADLQSQMRSDAQVLDGMLDGNR